MPRCKKIQELFIDALYETIGADKKKILDMHLAHCPQCSEAYAQMRGTLVQFDKYQKYEPPVEFWDRYWINLEQRLEKKSYKTLSINTWIKERVANLRWQPAWNYAIAGAVTMLIVGIFVGKYYFTKVDIAVLDDKTATDSNAYYSQSVAHAQRYLDRSKTLLLGFVNHDPKIDSGFKPNFSHPKMISQNLLRESADIKSRLKDANEQMLHELIQELDNILLQIANLEERYDLEAVEVIQSGIKRKGILFKINLEKILDLGHTNRAKKNSDKNQRMKGL